jgi:HAD superfamily hydrolase (TIGR01509 family)
MTINTIFFDVGNTLVFQNQERTLAPLWQRGVHPTEAQLYSAERAARQEMDLLISRARKVDQQYWETYYSHLLATIGITDISLRLELVALARSSANWTRVHPETKQVLEDLRGDYRLAVISNSDGRMAQLLESCGLGECFEAVIDSGNVGYEKPAIEIFQAALKTLSVLAEHSVYIGDIYSIDYLGARNAGMEAILMDVAGVYATRGLPRIESIEQVRQRIHSAFGGNNQ